MIDALLFVVWVPLGIALARPIWKSTNLSITDRRVDSAIAQLQQEFKERGKLARRLAQVETKVARLSRRGADKEAAE